MSALASILRKLLGLFIDDGAFALAILAWLAIVWASAARWPAVRAWGGPALFAGLALILLVSALRRARRS